MTLASELVKKLEEELSDTQRKLEKLKEKADKRWRDLNAANAEIKRLKGRSARETVAEKA